MIRKNKSSNTLQRCRQTRTSSVEASQRQPCAASPKAGGILRAKKRVQTARKRAGTRHQNTRRALQKTVLVDSTVIKRERRRYRYFSRFRALEASSTPALRRTLPVHLLQQWTRILLFTFSCDSASEPGRPSAQRIQARDGNARSSK